jgi:hypothetical protein
MYGNTRWTMSTKPDVVSDKLEIIRAGFDITTHEFNEKTGKYDERETPLPVGDSARKISDRANRFLL